MKQCTRCKEWKSFDNFHKHKKAKDGLNWICKECNKSKAKNHYYKNTEKVKERTSVYRESRPEQYKQYRREHYLKNKDLYKEQNREWIEKHPERNREFKRKWSRLNRDKVNEYRAKNRKVYDHNRRTRKMLLPDYLTVEEWDAIMLDFNNSCALSGSKDINMDHFIPLSTGHGGTYVGNVFPLEMNLNYKKYNTNPFEWIKRKEIQDKVDISKWNHLINYLAEQNGLSVSEFKEFVYWCFNNPRTKEQIDNDGLLSSLDLWEINKNKMR